MVDKRTFHTWMSGDYTKGKKYRSVVSLQARELMYRIVAFCGLRCVEDDGMIVPELNEVCWRLDEARARIAALEAREARLVAALRELHGVAEYSNDDYECTCMPGQSCSICRLDKTLAQAAALLKEVDAE